MAYGAADWPNKPLDFERLKHDVFALNEEDVR
jgi:hypothetical protein